MGITVIFKYRKGSWWMKIDDNFDFLSQSYLESLPHPTQWTLERYNRFLN